MKSKVTRIHPAKGRDLTNNTQGILSNRDKVLKLFWNWECVYRWNGLYCDWPVFSRGQRTSLRGGSLCKVVSSVHCMLLLILSIFNCLRYAPYFVTFTGITSENSVILLFMFVYMSGVWFYSTHMQMMARDYVRLAQGLARVFHTLATPPSVKNLKVVMFFFLSFGVMSWMLSTIPLFLQVLSASYDDDDLKSTRLLPAQPNTTMYIVALCVYGYISFFMYVGYVTLIAFVVFFCYIVGHAFKEITKRLRERANRFDPYSENCTVESEFCKNSRGKPKHVEESPCDDSNDGLSNPAAHYLRNSTIHVMKDLLEASDELDLEIFHLHHSSTSQRSDSNIMSQRPQDDTQTSKLKKKSGNNQTSLIVPTTGQRQSIHTLSVKGVNSETVTTEDSVNKSTRNNQTNAVKDTITVSRTIRELDQPRTNPKGENFKQISSTGSTQNPEKAKTENEEHRSFSEWTRSNVPKYKQPALDDVQQTFNSELEYLRYHHLKLMQMVQLGDAVIGSVVFTVYWQSIMMACFSLYSLIVGAFPSSEYFTLCFAIGAVVLQTLCCTSAGAWLCEKAHEQRTVLLQLNVCSLTEDDFRSLSMFLSQVQGEHIGITAFGFFPVNRATYLTVVGTIITYAVVVLQFNSGCQTTTVTGTDANLTLSTV